MRNCPNCQSVVQPEHKFCLSCGQTLPIQSNNSGGNPVVGKVITKTAPGLGVLLTWIISLGGVWFIMRAFNSGAKSGESFIMPITWIAGGTVLLSFLVHVFFKSLTK